MELLSVRSDFFARAFNNPGFKESQNKSLKMEGCSKDAMEAVKIYLYTGEMDFEQLCLSTLLHILNVSREILIEEELFNCIESYIKVAFSPTIEGILVVFVFPAKSDFNFGTPTPN